MLVTILLTASCVSSTRIAFGSCYGFIDRANPQIFDAIRNQEPQAFVWLGDTIYADETSSPLRFQTLGFTEWAAKYADLKNLPEYARLASAAKIFGTWDDHDYGLNNSDKTFPFKEEAKQLFLEFIGEPANSDRFKHPGVYTSHTIDGIKLILLDVRTFRDETDDLGAEQWKWLEAEMEEYADLYLIGSGLVSHFEYDLLSMYEHWHEASRKRLNELVRRAGGKTVILSGDVHFASLGEDTCSGYPIIEATSSGMSHTEFDYLGYWIGFYLNLILPSTYSTTPRLLNYNFGLLEVDWDDGTLSISIHDTLGHALAQHTRSLQYLQTLQEPSPSCAEPAFDRWVKSIVAMQSVFTLPILLFLTAFSLFVRKYSHSY